MWVKAGKKRERERIKDSRRSLPSICEKAGCVLCVARSPRTDTRVYQTTTGSYTHTTVHLSPSLPLSLPLSTARSMYTEAESAMMGLNELRFEIKIEVY